MVAAAIPGDTKRTVRGGTYPRTQPHRSSVEEQSKTQQAANKHREEMHAPNSACSSALRPLTAKTSAEMTVLSLHARIKGGRQRLCTRRAVEPKESLIPMETGGSLEHQGHPILDGTWCKPPHLHIDTGTPELLLLAPTPVGPGHPPQPPGWTPDSPSSMAPLTFSASEER